MEDQTFKDVEIIRKKWLFCFLSISFVQFAIIVKETNFVNVQMDLFRILIAAFITIFPSYLLAYLKKSTEWLKFLLGIIPLRLLTSYIFLFIYDAKTFQKQPDYVHLLLFVTTPMEIWYWVNCYNLLKCYRIEKLNRSNIHT